MLSNDALHRSVLKVCAWTGPAMTALFLVGAVPLARFFAPPYSVQHSLGEVARMYTDNLTGIRLGCVVMCFSAALFLPFGLAIAAAERQSDPVGVLLSWIQVASVAVATIVILFIPIFWAIGTYREGAVSAEITQTRNDAGWFGVFFAVPPFSLWCVAIAGAIMRPGGRLPRWSGYLNLWMAVLFMPAMMMIFSSTARSPKTAYSRSGCRWGCSSVGSSRCHGRRPARRTLRLMTYAVEVAAERI